jgi:hypothetical protein
MCRGGNADPAAGRRRGRICRHSLDVTIQVYANAGADIRRFVVTGRLPLFGVVASTKPASHIQSIKDLEGGRG